MFSIESHQPLRVLNPSVPTRFTYTEKCSPLTTTDFELSLDGKLLEYETDKVVAIYDWSGGYLRRETNWYWTTFGAVLSDNTSIGANFAAFTNETYFSENAFWIDHKRTRVNRVLYDFNEQAPYEPWHIYDEARTMDLIFTPQGERNDKMNGGPLVKMIFRQFVGTFDGFFKPENTGKIAFKGIKGFWMDPDCLTGYPPANPRGSPCFCLFKKGPGIFCIFLLLKKGVETIQFVCGL